MEKMEKILLKLMEELKEENDKLNNIIISVGDNNDMTQKIKKLEEDVKKMRNNNN